MTQYIYLVQMDIPEELDGYFNRIYNSQHAPNIRKVPGVISCNRYALESSDLDGVARYIASYFIDSPDVPLSPDWVAASDAGGWAALIDHYITNRSHSVYRRLSG